MLSNQPFLLEGNHPHHACLLLHGLGGGSFEMQLLGQHLHRNGYTVQALNYPGHDRKRAIMPASRWEEWYEAVRERYLSLRERFSCVSIVGFSTGCLLGLHLAASHDVHRLVCLSPFLAVRHRWYYVLRPERYLFSIGHLVPFVPRLRPPVNDPEMARHAEGASYFRTFSLHSARSAVLLIREVKNELGKVQTPILIIQSPRDRVVDPEGARYLFGKVGARFKELHWLRESNHIITIDVERQEVFSRVGQFLDLTVDETPR